MDQEEALERIERNVGNLCKPKGVKGKVLTYSAYEKKKSKLLSGTYGYTFAPDLDWLYDPDSQHEDLFPKADWGSDYNFVVVLHGDDEKELSILAAQILEREVQVGLVYYLTDK